MARDMLPEAETSPPTDAELIRNRWIAKLRNSGHRQCVGPMEHGTGNVCAIMLLHDMVRRYGGSPRATARNYAGLSEHQIDEIIAMNDGIYGRTGFRIARRTFAEIADVVEGWFK
jgi:hypothetical protein